MEEEYYYRYQYYSKEGKVWTKWMKGRGNLAKIKEISKSIDRKTKLKHEFTLRMP